mgnify:FL=1|jgi:hypothetical protein|tara:strand:+ start:273 stop:527 length:255 start_codon:yes stop_codon:yes gene_type:complete
MKTIKNSFNIERPFPSMFDGIGIGSETESISNPFSGDSVDLPPDAVAVYDVIKGSELTEDFDRVRAGLSWFRKYFPQEYMTLLD